jgi:BRCT domain type II-containing protein
VVVCREEMEQGREAKDPVREEVWEAAAVREAVVEEDEAAVPARARAGIVCVRTAERRSRTRRLSPATISAARNAAPR